MERDDISELLDSREKSYLSGVITEVENIKKDIREVEKKIEDVDFKHFGFPCKIEMEIEEIMSKLDLLGDI
ncbi:MAG: hypothetical protein IJX17_04930 [Clostridia bacterium]|nr:hypothetical protein [Clostridia bacterium]